MDEWEMFSELCKIVVEEKNVMLQVFVDSKGVEMNLIHIIEDDE